MKKTTFAILATLCTISCSNPAQNENSLLEKENELLKKENELIKREKTLQTTSDSLTKIKSETTSIKNETATREIETISEPPATKKAPAQPKWQPSESVRQTICNNKLSVFLPNTRWVYSGKHSYLGINFYSNGMANIDGERGLSEPVEYGSTASTNKDNCFDQFFIRTNGQTESFRLFGRKLSKAHFILDGKKFQYSMEYEPGEQ